MNTLSKDPKYPIYRLKIDPKHSDLKILTKELDAVGIRYSKHGRFINSYYEESEIPELYGLKCFNKWWLSRLGRWQINCSFKRRKLY